MLLKFWSLFCTEWYLAFSAVVAANSLKWSSSSVFKPFIEVTLVGPYLNFSKARAETKTKTNEWSPKFNEIFHL